MLTRLSAMLPINTRGMWIGTFHGLCNRLLRAHYREAGLPQTVPDPRFGRPAVGDQAPAEEPQRRRREISAARTVRISSTRTRSRACAPAQVEAYDDYTQRRVELYAEYDAQCQREGVVDFAELLLRCYELLSRNEPLRDHYQERFRHILVDEFQDTNRLQYAWLQAAGRRRRQRGLSRSATTTSRSTPSAAPRSATCTTSSATSPVANVINLEQNYRSHGNILDAANALIRHNREPPRQEPVDRRRRRRADPRVRGAGPTSTRRASSSTKSRELVREGVGRDQIALLYRSNAQSRVLEHAVVHRRRSLPRLWRPALLRAPGNQARAGLPAPDRQPRRRHGASCASSISRRAASAPQHRSLAGSRARRPTRASTTRQPALAGKAGSAVGGFIRADRGAARRNRRAAAARGHRRT